MKRSEDGDFPLGPIFLGPTPNGLSGRMAPNSMLSLGISPRSCRPYGSIRGIGIGEPDLPRVKVSAKLPLEIYS